MQQKSQIADFMINPDTIYKQLQCAICLNEVEQPALTKCGHSFCFKCIEEVINRYHKCPLCNFDLNMVDVFLNGHLNSIKSIDLSYIQVHLNEERDKQLNQMAKEVFGNANTQFIPEVNVLNNLFKKAINDLYYHYESKYLEAVGEYSAKVADLNVKFNEKVKQFNEKRESTDQIRQLHEKSIKEIKSSYESLKQYYVDCVKKNLEQFRCEQNQVDIFVQIIIPNRDIKYSDTLKIGSRITDVKQSLAQYFMEQKDPLTKFNPENIQVVIGKPQDIVPISALIQQQNLDYLQQQHKLHKLSDDQLLTSLGIRQGSIIFIIGDFQTKSQQPVHCLTYQFKKDLPVDYYTCTKCNIHWVCQACKDHCHKDHQTLMYKSKIIPEWACCYCVSKGFCKALNKNSQQ